MFNPFVSEYVEIVNLGNGKFTIIAKTTIPMNAIVEVCPVAILTLRESIILSKNLPMLKHAIFVDETVMTKEYQVLAQLGELELERRLDAGEITRGEYTRILKSKINPNALLETKSHVLILGNGSLYQISETPNLVCEYHSEHKICVFKSVRIISNGAELTYFKQ